MDMNSHRFNWLTFKDGLMQPKLLVGDIFKKTRSESVSGKDCKICGMKSSTRLTTCPKKLADQSHASCCTTKRQSKPRSMSVLLAEVPGVAGVWAAWAAKTKRSLLVSRSASDK